MYKLIRYFNQNRQKIVYIILIIVFIIAIIRLLNYLAEKDNSNRSINNEITDRTSINGLVSEKSALSGSNISTSDLKVCTDVIAKFIQYCNEKDIQNAYNLLTAECKEVMFPTMEYFIDIYYMPNFKEGKVTYTLENWSGTTYMVRITEDILTTGNVNNSETKQDYITVIQQNGEQKLNINNYIGRKIKKNEVKYENLLVSQIIIDTYMDYETYNIKLKNISNKNIVLGNVNETKSIYLLDSKDVKYYYYSNELIDSDLVIQEGFTKDLKIKFNNSYSTTRNIKNIVFSRCILDYSEYTNTENKDEYKGFKELKIVV